MRLRQVALVARDLETAAARLERLLALPPAYHDPGIIEFGLDNWVAPLGDTFLEVVSPVREGTTAGRYLDKRGGDGGYMVILQVDDLARARTRLDTAGARIVWHARGSGVGEERTEGLHVHPRDCGGAILSLDEATPPEAWVWAGPSWAERASALDARIGGVEMQSSQPEAMAQRWSELLGLPHVRQQVGDVGAWTIDLARSPQPPRGGVLRFVEDADGRGDGVSGLDLGLGDASSRDELVRRAVGLGLEVQEHPTGVSLHEAGIRIHCLDD
ncbi:MAG: hypothetical protein DWQ36_21525 [Acidobacteria bacterium]|nr:MAG: hypothetical protein DWQ36_21525 [Acidobacteriota bacterium]